MFSRDRLIAGIIGRKLDESWPSLVVNLLYAKCFTHKQTIDLQLNLVSSRLICEQLRQLSAYP